MHNTLSLLVASAALTLSSSAISSGTYKCTSPSGEIQYTFVPLAGDNCIQLELHQKAITPAIPDQPPTTTPAQPDIKTNTEDFERITQENCNRSQTRLETLTSNHRVRIKEGNKYRVLPEEERQQKIRLAEQQTAEYCQ